MKKYEINEEQVKGLLQYLSSKPYQEVAQGISMLSQLKKIEIENKK